MRSDEAEDLVPIDEVARQFGLKASAIRYYEERGLLEPACRRSGRRWYGSAELRRLAVIRYWQSSGMMTLEDIAEMLMVGDDVRPWSVIIDVQLERLRSQIKRMESAEGFLEHVRSHHDSIPDGCPDYERLIWSDTGD